jgi:hypothetical protein
MSDSDAPKIIVDDDWKSQAAAERERLAAKEREAAAKQAAAARGEGVPDGEVGFDALLGTLITQALLYMGAFPGPDGRAMVSLEHAKLHIDLLEVLEEKTRGNLTEKEQEDLTKSASELRLQFVEIVKAVAKMQAEGKMAPGGGAGMAGPGGGGVVGGGGFQGGPSGPGMMGM